MSEPGPGIRVDLAMFILLLYVCRPMIHNRQIQFLALTLTLAVFLTLSSGCNDQPEVILSDQEMLLVEDIVALYQAQLLAFARADSSGGSPVVTRLPLEEIEAQIAALASDPRRGAKLLSAVHDSLQAFRDELIEAAGPTDVAEDADDPTLPVRVKAGG